MNDIWEVLGIEPTTDKRKIKKAYAEAMKSCHPEEHPEEFKVLYEAYQKALAAQSEDNKLMIDTPVRTLQQEEEHSIPPRSEAVRPEIRQETSETACPGIQMVFARNDRKKQDAWEQLKTLWDTYLENRNRQNASELIRFIQGAEFSCIRDLDDTMRITMFLLRCMVAEDTGRTDDQVLCALCDIYAVEDTVFDEFDLAHLEDPVRRELSAALRDERLRRAQVRQQKRGRVGSILLNLAFFCGVAIYVIVIFVQILGDIKYRDLRDQCREEVAGILALEYPELCFGGAPGEWEITDGKKKNTYVISTAVCVRRDKSLKGRVHVEVECDQEGNITIISERFVGNSMNLWKLN